MARVIPYPDARVINISRRALTGYEHCEADLSDPAAWCKVADLFAREIEDFAGERVVFVHSAGTLQPIGFAGEVSADDYARQVLLNGASPQVLGDAFLRATRETHAECHVVMISSGSAFTVFEGWSAYCAGKAAMDQWVRTTGAEAAGAAWSSPDIGRTRTPSGYGDAIRPPAIPAARGPSERLPAARPVTMAV